MANTFALAAALCWMPISVILFACLPAARALSISFVAGWLLLPFVQFKIPMVPDFSKATAILLGSATGLLFSRDAARLLQTFRLSWIDLPAVLLCFSAVVTSLLNGLGLWDGVSSALYSFYLLTGPYFLGRLVFRSAEDVLELVKAIFVGGLLYVPLCLFEVRMSPQLHSILYGFAPRGWRAPIRFGGYRPSVFLETGLELGMWMTVAALIGVWLYYSRTVRNICGVPCGILLFALLITTVLCKSTGALLLLGAGVTCILFTRLLNAKLILASLLLVTPTYIGLRATGAWNATELVELARIGINDERAGSLEYRIMNENVLAEKALQRPWFGWGGWGRSHVYDDFGNDLTASDGLWVQMLGMRGLVGMACGYAVLIVPAAMLCLSPINGHALAKSPAFPLALAVALYSVDTLLNSMENPIYVVALGGILCVAQTCGAYSTPRARAIEHDQYITAQRRSQWPPIANGLSHQTARPQDSPATSTTAP